MKFWLLYYSSICLTTSEISLDVLLLKKKVIYSETTSTGATLGLSANQKPILKQRNERADLTGNCLIFRLVTFDPKFLTFKMAYSWRQPIRDWRILAFSCNQFHDRLTTVDYVRTITSFIRYSWCVRITFRRKYCILYCLSKFWRIFSSSTKCFYTVR